MTQSNNPIRDELKHHGILGMKWGIRRYQNADGSLTPAGQKRQQKIESSREEGIRIAKEKAEAKSIGEGVATVLVSAQKKAKEGKVDKTFLDHPNISQKAKDKVLKTADKAWAKDIKKNMSSNMNKAMTTKESQAAAAKSLESLTKVGVRGPALQNAYNQSVAGIIDKAWAADKSLYNPSGTKRLTMFEYRDEYGNSYMAPRVWNVDEIKHIDSDPDEEEIIMEVFTIGTSGDGLNNITLVKDVESEDSDKFIHHDADVEATLAHYGILGMKWGVRKDRSSDGTGKKNKSQGSGDYQKTRKQLKRGMKNLSTKELKDLSTRLNLEKQIKDLKPSEYKEGLAFVKKITAAGTTLAGLYALSKTPLAQDIIKAIKT